MKEKTCRHCKFCKEFGFYDWYDHQCVALVAEGGVPMPILRHHIDGTSVCEQWTERTNLRAKNENNNR